MRLAAIVRNALRPGYLPAMAHKVKLRLFDQVEDETGRALSTEWCAKVAEDERFASELDPNLWAEAQRFAARLQAKAQETLRDLKSQVGGGGHYGLLYFLARHRKPSVVVETGVAAGFSTAALLSAIRENGHGHLYSSDFPLFRLKEPEQYIGCLVPADLKPRWTLYLKGDRRNLPIIAAAVPPIDLFHYDSDKTYSGRAFGLAQIEPRLSADGIMLMDDIQDNLFFHDYVQRRGCRFRVVQFEGKYLGLVGI